MDHQWRPTPIQGNICPVCSVSHFPFCPSTRYPGHMGITRSVSHGTYHDPGSWNRNPNLPLLGNFGIVDRYHFSMQDHSFNDFGYVGSDCNVNDDRSSKRLRVDGICHPPPFGGEVDGNLSDVPVIENESRLKLVRDHGGPGLASGFDGDVRGYGDESVVLDRNVEGRDRGVSSNVGMGTGMMMGRSTNVGYSVDYQREEMGHQSGYGSHCGIKRSGMNAAGGLYGNRFQNVGDPVSQYGVVDKLPDPVGFHQGGVRNVNQLHGYSRSSYGNSHVANESFFGENFEPRHPNNAALCYEQRSEMPMPTHYSGNQPSVGNTMQHPGQMRYDYQSPSLFNDARQPAETRVRPIERYQGPYANHNTPMQSHYGHGSNQGSYGDSVSENMGHIRASQGFDVHPPLPPSSPPPMEPPASWSVNHKPSTSPPNVSSSLLPIAPISSAGIQSSYAPTYELHMRAHPQIQNSHLAHSSGGMFQGDSHATLTSSGHHLGEGQRFPSKNNVPEKSKIIDAFQLFKPPHRATRPDHFVIILRGLPGSGKSYLAKMLRDLEVEHGGNAPRIHSMDDYFMTETEKAEENEASKSSARGKRFTMKVLEYCYEPEMEEAYRASMLKAFKKTLEEGVFTFVIVDDRNLRVADFAQFWATAKRSGYEVYILEAPYKDPAGCTARNIHGFTLDDVEKMVAEWEEAPSLHFQLDVKSLFHGDDLAESNIQEVDMDTENGDLEEGLPRLEEKESENIVTFSGGDVGTDAFPKERNWDGVADNPSEEVKDLRCCKWSSNLDEEDDDKIEMLKGKSNVLSGLLGTYGKEGKSVHWGDKGGHAGFSLGAMKKASAVSLVIGPGAGYNLKSNSLHDVDTQASAKSGETRKHSVFKERLRAEQESFRAVFDRRRHRIGGLDAEDE